MGAQSAADPNDRRALELAEQGNGLLGIGRPDDAWRCFEEAVSLGSPCAPAHNGLGVIESARGNVHAAISHFRAALNDDPFSAGVASNLGYALAETGDLVAAVEHLQRAISLEPRNPRHYRLLLLIAPETLEAGQLDTLEQLSHDTFRLSKQERIELHFALGRTFDRKGRIDEAFAQFVLGNQEKRTDVAYDEERTLRFMASLPKILRSEFLDELRGCGNTSRRPIFIFGMPRSGSTLVEHILAAHPDVIGAGELGIFSKLANELPPIRATTPAETVKSSIGDLGRRYLAETESLSHGSPHVVDKTLLNFVLAPLINAALPNARLIYVRRDPVDTCWSCYTTLCSDNLAFTWDLGELGRYYRAHETLMETWKSILPRDRFLEVRYEDVVENLEAEARRLVAFCGLPWVPQCLDFHSGEGTVRTASLGQVRRPIYRDAIGSANRYRKHAHVLIAALQTPT